jgi:hypothetical protein
MTRHFQIISAADHARSELITTDFNALLRQTKHSAQWCTPEVLVLEGEPFTETELAQIEIAKQEGREK